MTASEERKSTNAEHKSQSIICKICKSYFNDRELLLKHVRRAHFGDYKDANVVINIGDSSSSESDPDTPTIYAAQNSPTISMEIPGAKLYKNTDKDSSEELSVLEEKLECAAISSTEMDKTPISSNESPMQQVNCSPMPGPCDQIMPVLSLRCNKRVICNICIEEFKCKNDLNKHIKASHFGIKHYKCAMCSKSFEDRLLVIRHYNTCSGIPDDPSVNDTAKENVKHNHQTILVKKRMKSNILKQKWSSSVVQLKRKRHYSRYMILRGTKMKKTRISERLKKINHIKHAMKTKKKQQKRIIEIKSEPKKCASNELVTSTFNPLESDNQLVKDPNYSAKSLTLTETVVIPDKSIPEKPEKLLTDHHTFLKCFLCSKVLSETNFKLSIQHFIEIHPACWPLDIFTDIKEAPGMIEYFKCLRCGKVGTLLSIQMHIQHSGNSSSCIRSLFPLRTSEHCFCTVCGEEFAKLYDHDQHVISNHYRHLKAFSINIFSPCIVGYKIPPDCCKHCGSKCNLTESRVLATHSQRFPKRSCIDGPYVCPYNHESKHSRSTIEHLLFHTKFCDFRGGVIALQCNNCFKMLLCSSNTDQIAQLKEVIACEYLQCCDDRNKTFKCYCCGLDLHWDKIVSNLRMSINKIEENPSGSNQLFVHDTAKKPKPVGGSLHNRVPRKTPEAISAAACHRKIVSKTEGCSKSKEISSIQIENSNKTNISIAFPSNERFVWKIGSTGWNGGNNLPSKEKMKTLNGSACTITNPADINQEILITLDNSQPPLNIPEESHNVICHTKQRNGKPDVQPSQDHDSILTQENTASKNPAPESQLTDRASVGEATGPLNVINIEGCVKICEICSKEIDIRSSMDSFIIHMVHHEKERSHQHKCWECGCKFRSRELWIQHIGHDHPGSELLNCRGPGCNLQFQRPQDLQDHIVSEHYGLFGCCFCFTKFGNEADLSNHIGLVH